MNTQEKTVHPLMAIGAKRLTYLSNEVNEWHERWNHAATAEEFKNLLYDGPKFQGWDIGFYLEIADGYDKNDFRTGNEYDIFKYRSPVETLFGKIQFPGDVRKALAGIAFKILCLEFFKDKAVREYHFSTPPPSWSWCMTNPYLCAKVLDFFAPREEGDRWEIGRIKNLRSMTDHPYDIAYQFLCDFTRFSWDGWESFTLSQTFDRDEFEKIGKEVFRPLRPKILKLLWALRKLTFVLHPKERWPTKEELELIRKLALLAEIEDYYSRKSRRVATIGESLLAGSEAAAVYLLINTKKAEDERLEKDAKLAQKEDKLKGERKKLKARA